MAVKKKILKKAKKKVAKVKKAIRPKGRMAVKAAKTKAAKPVGKVVHFYNNIRVAIVKFNAKVKVGSALRFHGATTDFIDIAKSMQYDHKPIAVAPKGKQVGIKVKKRVREGDLVYIAE